MAKDATKTYSKTAGRGKKKFGKKPIPAFASYKKMAAKA